MSQVIITFCSLGGRADSKTGDQFPVARLEGAVSEEIASSGASQATTATSLQDAGTGFVEIDNNGSEDIWITAAATPVAAVGTSVFIPSGKIKSYSVNPGVKIAIINDS